MLAAAVVLAVIAIVVNLRNPQYSIATAFKEKPKSGKATLREPRPPHPPGKPVKPVGSKEAKVVIKVFAESGNPCHMASFTIPTKLAEAVPKRIRVEFLDSGSEVGTKAMEKAGISCEAGMMIDGKSSYTVTVEGERVHVEFHGPVGMDVPIKHLRAVVEQELHKKYPEGLTPDEQRKLEAFWREAPELLAGEGEGGAPDEAEGPVGRKPPIGHQGKADQAAHAVPEPELSDEAEKALDHVLDNIVKSAKDKKPGKPAQGDK